MKKADNYTLYLSGVINENEYDGTTEPVNAQDLGKLLQKLTMKLGEKANTYKPLLTYIKNRPELVSLLDDLITHVGQMKSTTFGQINKQIWF